MSGCVTAVGPMLQPGVVSLLRRRLILRQPPGHVGYACPSSPGYLRIARVRASAARASLSEDHLGIERTEAHTAVKNRSEGIVVLESEPEPSIPSASSSSGPVKTCNMCGRSKLLVDFEKTVNSEDKRTEACRACLAALKAMRPGARQLEHLMLTPEEAWERAKICACCSVKKEIREFCRQAASKDGVSSRCRACASRLFSTRSARLPVDAPQRCKKCNEVKPAAEYHANKSSSNGLRNVCKPCWSERAKKRDSTLKQSIVHVRRREKLCTVCKKTKPVSEFYKQSLQIDGLRGHCKDCTKARKKTLYRQAAKATGAVGTCPPL
jgi:hypothetical protein